MDESISFGDSLKQCRTDAGVSQSKLAEQADFDHSYVSRLESGARSPSREAVTVLAEALGLEQVGRDQLLVSAGFMPSQVGSLLSDEPEVNIVLELLRDHSLPANFRENIRATLHLLSEQAQLYRTFGMPDLAITAGG